ncbi:Hypothetical protein DAL_157 [Psychrobacter phage D'Alembert]|nr:Hypothetical protein DAL_14 [Psychrobacter phage D'Alembert]CAH1193579.1 Hypothetical protein DAL_157 [Psychrobacter phage D'Alembert]
MSTLIAANLILWFSVFSWFMPAAIDKQVSNDGMVVVEHKLNNEGV